MARGSASRDIHFEAGGSLAPPLAKSHGLTRSDVTRELTRVRGVLPELLGPQAPSGFVRVLRRPSVLRAVEACALRWRRRKLTDLIHIGIGGSALGAEALLRAAGHPHHNLQADRERCGPRVHFVDNVDPETLGALFDVVDPRNALVHVVSKSGSTVETAAGFQVVRDAFERAGRGLRWASRCVFTTGRGVLRELGEREGVEILDFPEDIGGRFSVLTASGLLTPALAGVDVAAVVAGARRFLSRVSKSPLRENPAAVAAAAAYLMAERKKKPIHVLMPYADALEPLARWYVQLIGESLGKRKRRGNRFAGVGPTPLPARGTTDQHSQVQLFVDGPADKWLTFVAIQGGQRKQPIPRGDLADYLNGVDLGSLLRAEQRGTAIALARAGRPSASWVLPELQPHTLGQLFFALQLQTAFQGALYGVDAYDQPGVEAGKIAAFALIGRDGFEAERAAIEANTPPRWCIWGATRGFGGGGPRPGGGRAAPPPHVGGPSAGFARQFFKGARAPEEVSMRVRPDRLIALWMISACLAIPGVGRAASTGPDPANYPALSTLQMGQVRHLINLANQRDGDWSMMGQTGPGQNFDAYQFQIAFAVYALAVTHYHYAPAHRDLYHDTSAKWITKMIYKDVWDYWAQMSKFEYTGTDSGADLAYTEDDWYGWIDPNVKKNIMYSGHLLQMVGLHEMLFDDRRYDDPGSLLFRFAPVQYGQSPIEIQYDHNRLAKVIFDQFVEVKFRGIECERNAVYTECNQHPILGLMHYDFKHATQFSPGVQREFKKTIEKRHYVSPETHTTMYYLDVKQDRVVPATYAWSDGWNGHAHHVWDKPLIESLYPHQRKLYIPSMLEGLPGEDMGWTASFDFGWFALLASEVGDTETVQTMSNYADAHFQPTWKEGGYYYPHTSDYQENFSRDDEGFIANISPVTSNVLIGFARLNPRDGLWQIYNRPWDASHFAEPFISDVAFREANVVQAVFDAKKDALIVTLSPGPAKSETTSFSVRQLDSAKTYRLIKDGQLLGEIRERDPLQAPGTAWQTDGSLRITTALQGPHSFVLEASSTSLAAP